MTDARISQLGAEVWSEPVPNARVSQLGAEVWSEPIAKAQVSQLALEVWYTLGEPIARVTSGAVARPVSGIASNPTAPRVTVSALARITPPVHETTLPLPKNLYVRKQTSVGDYQFGHSRADFWSPQVEAVRQTVETRLKLMQTEWFLDLTEGTPYSTQVLGVRTRATYDQAIKKRILGTKYVHAITSYSSVLKDRKLNIIASIDSDFGPITLETSLSVYQVNA